MDVLDVPSGEMLDLLALHLVPGLGPRLTAALRERFGSAAAVRRATAEQLRQVAHIGPKLSEDFCRALAAVNLDEELGLIAAHNVHLLGLGLPGYPPSLATLAGAPPVLYVRGTIEPGDAKAVALVGSRHCTGYGRKMAARLAGGLVRAGYVVVSGLARGIDGAAHRAALEAGGRTLAVLGNGLSFIYPPEHAELADALVASGAVLTEAVMRGEPLAAMFPARNRIISGLSRGVVIVEAPERSGALITAEHAAEQGRPVFAVPGPADAGSSAGCNELIRDGATLVRSADDILEELEGLPVPEAEASAPEPPPPELEGLARQIWDMLGEGPRHVDEMAQALSQGVPALARTLMELEMKRRVRRLPGNRYERA